MHLLRHPIVQQAGEHCVRIGKTLYCEVSDHFIPHEGNGYHPHVLKHRVLFGYSVLLILVKIFVVTLPIALPSSSIYSSAITPQNIIDLTNQTRENLGITKLSINPKLATAALAKADDMLERQYFAHTSPAGVTPWDWIRRAGYNYLYSGENLAVHYVEAEDVAGGWLASPTHRANIVNPKYSEIGVGVAQGQFEGFPSTVVVQFFGNPVSQKQTPPAVSVASASPTKPAKKGAPSIDDAQIVVKPKRDTYAVRVAVAGATSASVQLAAESAPLSREGSTDRWQGEVPYDRTALSGSGDPLSVTAQGSAGASESKTIAWVAPKTQIQQFYTFNEGSDRYAKFFGGLFTVHSLQDSVRRFYVYFMIFLAGALLLNIVIKIRIQRQSVINHAMLVLALTLFLTIV